MIALALLLAAGAPTSARATTAVAPALAARADLAEPGDLAASADLAALEARLASRDARERREAVRALSKESDPKAWQLVLGALRDPEAMVADEAQLAFAQLEDPAAAGALLGKEGLGSADAAVRARAAEAIGRVRCEVDGGALAKKLGDKDAELRRTLAWSAERLAAEGRLAPKSKRFLQQELEAATRKDPDALVRAAALTARHALEPWTVSEIFEELSGKRPHPLRCAAIGLMAREEPGQIPGLVAGTLAEDDPSVRRAIADAFAARGLPIDVENLIYLLRKETNLRTSWRIVGHLERLSGRALGRDRDAWEQWFRALPEGWRKADEPAKDAAPKQRDHAGSTTVIFEMPVLSDRVAFLFDFSGSMWEAGKDGRTRKQRLGHELARALAKLPETAEFNLVPYATEPRPWQKALVPATQANVAKATAFFEGCELKGKGDLALAMRAALEDPEVDTLFVFSDGAPSGTRWNLDLVRDQYLERDRFRRVAVDVLLLGATKSLRERWAGFCAATGGELGEVELD